MDSRLGRVEVICRIVPCLEERGGICSIGNGGRSVLLCDPTVGAGPSAGAGAGGGNGQEGGAIQEYAVDVALQGTGCEDDLNAAACAPIVDWVWQGFNASLIAIGQSGSWKTSSVFGQGGFMQDVRAVPMMEFMIQQLFSRLMMHESSADFVVALSVWHVLGDDVIDLLSSVANKTASTAATAASDADTGGHGADSNNDDKAREFVSVRCHSAKGALSALHYARKRAAADMGHLFVRLALLNQTTGQLSLLHVVDLAGAHPTSTLTTEFSSVAQQTAARDPVIARKIANQHTQLRQVFRDLARAQQEEEQGRELETDISEPLPHGHVRGPPDGRMAPSRREEELVAGEDDVVLSRPSLVPSAMHTALTQVVAPLLQGNSKTWVLACVKNGQSHFADNTATLRLAMEARPLRVPCYRVVVQDTAEDLGFENPQDVLPLHVLRGVPGMAGVAEAKAANTTADAERVASGPSGGGRVGRTNAVSSSADADPQDAPVLEGSQQNGRHSNAQANPTPASLAASAGAVGAVEHPAFLRALQDERGNSRKMEERVQMLEEALMENATSYETALSKLQMDNMLLQRKLDRIIEQNDFHGFFAEYEKDLSRVEREADYLRERNIELELRLAAANTAAARTPAAVAAMATAAVSQAAANAGAGASQQQQRTDDSMDTSSSVSRDTFSSSVRMQAILRGELSYNTHTKAMLKKVSAENDTLRQQLSDLRKKERLYGVNQRVADRSMRKAHDVNEEKEMLQAEAAELRSKNAALTAETSRLNAMVRALEKSDRQLRGERDALVTELFEIRERAFALEEEKQKAGAMFRFVRKHYGGGGGKGSGGGMRRGRKCGRGRGRGTHDGWEDIPPGVTMQQYPQAMSEPTPEPAPPMPTPPPVPPSALAGSSNLGGDGVPRPMQRRPADITPDTMAAAGNGAPGGYWDASWSQGYFETDGDQPLPNGHDDGVVVGQLPPSSTEEADITAATLGRPQNRSYARQAMLG